VLSTADFYMSYSVMGPYHTGTTSHFIATGGVRRDRQVKNTSNDKGRKAVPKTKNGGSGMVPAAGEV